MKVIRNQEEWPSCWVAGSNVDGAPHRMTPVTPDTVFTLSYDNLLLLELTGHQVLPFCVWRNEFTFVIYVTFARTLNATLILPDDMKVIKI